MSLDSTISGKYLAHASLVGLDCSRGELEKGKESKNQMVAEKEDKYNSSLFAVVSCTVVSVVLGMSAQEGSIYVVVASKSKSKLESVLQQQFQQAVVAVSIV